MRKLMIASGAAALLAASSFSAFADDVRAAITEIDPTANTVTIDTGATLSMPTGYQAADLSVGDLISVDYDPSTMMIDTFEVVEDGPISDARGDDTAD